MSHILSNCEDMHAVPVSHIRQVLTRFRNKVSQAIKYTKKYQIDSEVEFNGCHSQTESDSDSAEGTEGEDEVSASSVIYSSKNSYQQLPMAGCKIN